MVSMRKDVITMLFTGDYCSAHTAEKQDTSIKTAGNDNIGSHEDLEGGKHPTGGVQLGDETLSMSHLLNRRMSVPDGPLRLQAIVSKMRSTPDNGKACSGHYTDNLQAGPYEGGTRGVPTKEGAKMFFLQGRDTLLPDLPSAKTNGPQTSK